MLLSLCRHLFAKVETPFAGLLLRQGKVCWNFGGNFAGFCLDPKINFNKGSKHSEKISERFS